jgi:uncharacterized protein (TIGR00251 family)
VSSWYRRSVDGVLSISIHAQPGAKRTEVAGLHGDALKIRVAAPANAALIEFVANKLGVARRDVTIASGEKSRAKRLEIRGASVEPERLLTN